MKSSSDINNISGHLRFQVLDSGDSDRTLGLTLVHLLDTVVPFRYIRSFIIILLGSVLTLIYLDQEKDMNMLGPTTSPCQTPFFI